MGSHVYQGCARIVMTSYGCVMLGCKYMTGLDLFCPEPSDKIRGATENKLNGANTKYIHTADIITPCFDRVVSVAKY